MLLQAAMSQWCKQQQYQCSSCCFCLFFFLLKTQGFFYFLSSEDNRRHHGNKLVKKMEISFSVKSESLESHVWHAWEKVAKVVMEGLENGKCTDKSSCFVPWAELSTSTAGEEEDGSQNQDSDQEDGQDHQEEHVAISVLLARQRDPLKKERVMKGGRAIRSDRRLIVAPC